MIIKIYFTRKIEKNLLTQFLTIAAQLPQLRHSNFCREKGFIVEYLCIFWEIRKGIDTFNYVCT